MMVLMIMMELAMTRRYAWTGEEEEKEVEERQRQRDVESVEDDIRRIHTDVVNSALKWGQVLKDYSLKKRNIMESLDAIEAKDLVGDAGSCRRSTGHSMSNKWALAACGGDMCLSLSVCGVVALHLGIPQASC
uniref:Uncharacterized protein n=1 Tax=Timema douglasi TaxID=61478 RepID=A0A7R8VVV2_TIMDO|nr:unnamed protein product [Timema douglasi]